MKKSVNITGAVILLLCVAVVVMAFGFASFSENLQIAGNVTIAASKWSIHYKTDSYSETTNSVIATSKTLTGTSFSFDVSLTKPGDFYEATIPVVNDGTFNATLNSITMGGVDESNDDYLKYTITYDGTTYDKTTTGLSSALAANNGTKNLVVRIEYLQPSDPTSLPVSGANATITGTLNFVQA